MSNPFTKKYSLKTKKVKIEELDNAEVTITELTVDKASEFYKRLFSLEKADGTVGVNPDEIVAIKLEKVAEFMIEPKMTVDELKALGASANVAISKIADEIDALSAGN